MKKEINLLMSTESKGGAYYMKSFDETWGEIHVSREWGKYKANVQTVF